MQTNQARRRFDFALTSVLMLICSALFLRPAISAPSPANSFVSSAQIRTESGPRAIETLQIGDQVWGKDAEHSQAELKSLTETVAQQFSGILVAAITT